MPAFTTRCYKACVHVGIKFLIVQLEYAFYNTLLQGLCGMCVCRNTNPSRTTRACQLLQHAATGFVRDA